MSIYTKITRPEFLPGYGGGEYIYNETRGMEYNVHEYEGQTYLACCHESVGIVKFFLVHDVDAMYADIYDDPDASEGY